MVKKAWKLFKKYFEPDTLANIMSLKHRFWTLKLKNEEIARYATELRHTSDKLQELDEPISELDKVFQLLRYLPGSYEGMVQEMYTRKKQDLIFLKIVDEVLAENTRLHQ